MVEQRLGRRWRHVGAGMLASTVLFLAGCGLLVLLLDDVAQLRDAAVALALAMAVAGLLMTVPGRSRAAGAGVVVGVGLGLVCAGTLLLLALLRIGS